MGKELLVHLGSCPVVKFRVKAVVTDGDRDPRPPLRELAGTDAGGFSPNQLQDELSAGRIDIAVHSLEDLPTSCAEGLALAVTPPRYDPRDALCGSSLAGLRPGAKVGTGSPRRIAQLKALRPDVTVIPLRGNVPTRLAKLKSGLDAVVLAASGLERLGASDAITEFLDPQIFPPAPGQGALGVQVRASDRELLAMLNSYGDPDSDAAVRAERALLAQLHGGCSVPVGAHAELAGGELRLNAQVPSPDGCRLIAGTATGTDPDEVGLSLAARLLAQGAD